MDQEIRNKLRNVVTRCRKLLEDSISQELEGKYGIFGKKDQVTADPNAKMTHLTDEEQAARKDILDHFAHIKARGFKPKDALDQLVREIAFTHLNRLCAYKMMEAREVYVGGQKFREAVSRGVNSNGVKFYLADHPDEERLYNTGHQDVAYRHFLDWLGGLLSDEIGVLFSPNDSANRLYPRQKTLDEVLDLLNGGGIKADETELRKEWPKIWSQDETIGWVYQYFTPKELRDQARKESSAPRNSYELAFRNQFFTPRYVVEFLTDNTLGRIWYEMRKGDTKLKDQCRYMVRRPNEIFLTEGQHLPNHASGGREDLSQEELLMLPVYILHRPKKDPRKLKMLDPASGSGHFLLYCFDLLLMIYVEAYADPVLGPALQNDYPKLEDLLRDVPRLILANNLHGIDIDLRCTQIAALALWLRCQRAYQEMGLKKDRPKITRSNFVCAEPMPGEEHMLKEFVGRLEPKLLGQLVEVVFDRMKLAGEAGSLLKIEEEIRDAVAQAKKLWLRESTPAVDEKGRSLLFSEAEMDRLKGGRVQASLFDVSDITEAQFFEQAERKVVEALRQYAEKAQNGQRLQRRLFTEDAVRGFAFVDICHKRFDVVLMNPPFGDSSKPAKALIEKQYPLTKNDVYTAFVEQGIYRLDGSGMLGAITSRTGFFISSFQKWREDILLKDAPPTVFADLGYGVLDTAMVETAAYCLAKGQNNQAATFCRLLEAEDKKSALCSAVDATNAGRSVADLYHACPVSFGQVSSSPFAYWVSERVRELFKTLPHFESDNRTVKQGLATADDFRFVRCWWEVSPHKTLDGTKGPYWRDDTPEFQAWCRQQTFEGIRWVPFAKGGAYSPFYSAIHLVVNWEREGKEIKERINPDTEKPYSNVWQLKGTARDYFFRPGLTWPIKNRFTFKPWPLPAGAIFAHVGAAAFMLESEMEAIHGLMSSAAFTHLLRISAGWNFEVGVIRLNPVAEKSDSTLGSVCRQAVDLKRSVELTNEASHLFVSPFVSAKSPYLADFQAQLDDLAFQLYGIGPEDRSEMDRQAHTTDLEAGGEPESEDDPDPSLGMQAASDVHSIRELMSYAVGCVSGRWDILYATGEKKVPELPDSFDPLPVSPPGMLQGDDGLPLTKSPEGYPLHIDWDGIFVDDPDHTDDIVRRVRDALEVIWKDKAEAIEQEACEVLGVKDLRDYFRKPGKGGFWNDHVSRYSKSRRKAPIYWLLQSSRKNYALWLYYHRLDKDLLFKALVNYIEPKIRLEASRLETLRSQRAAAGESGKEAKRLAKEVEQQEDFLSELRDFEDKLRRAANLHLETDLNDGVVLNIAPLHELVPWNEAKNYWEELLEGKYEWSSIGKQLQERGLVK